MTNKAWLNLSEEPEPGAEVFRSDREFKLWAYSPSHSRLLLRSWAYPNPQFPDRRGRTHETTVEILFAPVDAVKINTVHDGLTIRCATRSEANSIEATTGLDDDQPVLIIESQGITGHIVTGGIGWCEDILSPTRLSFFASILPDQPAWPRHPLGPGFDAGLGMASMEELIHEFNTVDSGARTRNKYRYVHVVMTRVEHQTKSGESDVEVTNAGAFLTEAEAEDLKAQLEPVVAACWIDKVPIAV